MTVRILQGNCVDTMRALDAASVHTCVTSPPYWGLRDYQTEPLEWPAIAYAPMPGLPPLVEIPAMTCSLGLEPTIEAFIGHQLLVFREVRRVLRDDGTCWVNMGDSYAGSRCGGTTEASTLRNPGQKIDASSAAKQRMTAGRRRDNEPVPRSDVRIPGLKPKDLVGQPWRLALALQADGWWLRCDVIWSKKNPMPESTKDRPTKAHEYVFLLSKSETYYYDWQAIAEPASEDTHARYARGRSDSHKHAQATLVPGNKPQTIAQSFAHMRKPVAGWATGEGDHSAIGHAAPDEDRQTKLLPTASQKYRDDPVAHRTKTGLAAAERKARPRKTVEVDPENRNKRSVWTISTEPFPEAHFATFPTKLIEPCILAGCPEGGTVLDPFGGSGTTGLVADRLGRNAVLCELNPDYIAIGERRLAGDAGHVARQIPLEAA